MARASSRHNGGTPPPEGGSLTGRTIVLGVTGSIAAYKAIELLRLLTKDGADVHVLLTEGAQRFVAPLTFQVLSGHRVITSTWDEPEPEPPAPQTDDAVETVWSPVGHIDVATRADLVVVAPATANAIGKLAHGVADDALSTLLLAVRCPVVFAPAMNTAMYTHPAVVANIGALAGRGVRFVDPESGELACRTVGTGRLADPSVIHAAIRAQLASPRAGAWNGRTVLVTAGRTEEAIDPVRVITNRSSGKMGVALARAARNRGARVILVAGAMSVDPPSGVDVRRVTSAADMAAAVRAAASRADVVVMAAAVSDYTPAPSKKKIERSGAMTLSLTPTDDILAGLGRAKGDRVIVGFALETGRAADDLARARAKLQRKNCDLIVLNNVLTEGAEIGGDTNVVTLLGRTGAPEHLSRRPKSEVAAAILDRVEKLLARPRSPARARTRS